MKSVVPDVPRYVPHYTVAGQDKAEACSAREGPGFKVWDATLNANKDDNAGCELGEIAVPISRAPDAQGAGRSDKLDSILPQKDRVKGIWQNPPAGTHVARGTRIQFQLSTR
jgi:hypothetical protein